MANCWRCGKVLTTLGVPYDNDGIEVRVHKTCKPKAEAEVLLDFVDTFLEQHREDILRRVPDYKGPELKSGLLGELVC